MKIEIADLTLVPGIAVVKLYNKGRSRKETQTVLDDEKNKGKDPKKDIMALKTVETKVLYNIQPVEILSIGENTHKYEIGDVVIMDFRKVKEFDLVKDVHSINVYDILGKVNLQ
jgi:hypothetical protein